MPDGFFISDLPETSKTDSPHKRQVESTPTTPLLEQSSEKAVPNTYNNSRIAQLRKLPEKRPRTREIPRKVLNSVEKPDSRALISNNKSSDNKEENKHPNQQKDLSPKSLLSLRKDVVYKTLIRSVKRYLTEK